MKTSEKITATADAIAFSERKHFNYSGGLDALRAEMEFDLLNRIRNQAEKRRAAGD